MSEEILLTNEMRLRIIDLEYQDLSGEELAKEIKRIYLEVEGEEFPAEIDVYQTGQNADYYSGSGYKGSAVRFYSEENDIEEVRSEEHTSELQSRGPLVCRHLLDQKEDTKNACV